MPYSVFISYSHKDQRYFQKLVTYLSTLQKTGKIDHWSDTQIAPGTEWRPQIMHHLQNDQIILLLISADFISSDFCYDIEMQQALERHKKNQARVLPILLRPTDIVGLPISDLQILPSGQKPVSRWPSVDDAFENITMGIRRAIDDLERLQTTTKPV